MRHLAPIPLALMAACASVSAAPLPCLELCFNGGGSAVENSGTDSLLSVAMLDAQGAESDLRSPDSGGVSGRPGDRAFDNRAATAMGFRKAGEGEPSGGGRVEVVGLERVLDGAKSLTLTGWFKASEERPGSNARLVDLSFSPKGKGAHDIGSGLSLRATGDKAAGRCAVELFHSQGTGQIYRSTDPGTFSEVDEWFFVAVVYDATSPSGPRLTLYRGYRNSAPQPVFAESRPPGPLTASSLAKSAIGNAAGSTAAPFQGLIDNVRLYVSPSDGDAALDQRQIEKIRRADLDSRPPQL